LEFIYAEESVLHEFSSVYIFYRLFEEKYGIAFVRRSTVGVEVQFCGRVRLLGILEY